MQSAICSSALSGVWQLQEITVNGRQPALLNKVAKGTEYNFLSKDNILSFGDDAGDKLSYKISVTSIVMIDLIGPKSDEIERGFVVIEKGALALVFSTSNRSIRPRRAQYEKRDDVTIFTLTRKK